MTSKDSGPARSAPGMPALFEKLALSLDVRPVTKPAHPTQPQRMNANSFCIRNRVFAMKVGDELVLKLPPARVTALIASGVATSNVVGRRPMTEWANFATSTSRRWPSLAKESLDYVRDKP